MSVNLYTRLIVGKCILGDFCFLFPFLLMNQKFGASSAYAVVLHLHLAFLYFF
jgi:hypothetical protein